jgi:two-component sensor histidine kinase
LITNGAKYAYEGRTGKIWVTLTVSSAGKAVISVRDEGKGLPPDFSIKSGGLGMRLVRAFADSFREIFK